MAANTQGKRSPCREYRGSFGGPASREPAEQPDDPEFAAVEVARARGLKPEEVLAERRRVLRSRG